LRSQFNQENTWWNTRNNVQNVISASQNLNLMMNDLPFRSNLERQWNQLRTDINTLADTYDLPGLNGGGWTGGPWNPGNPGGPGWTGGQTSTPPGWAQGTFYSTNGTNIQLSIDSSGRATVVNSGQSYYGAYYRNNLTVNGDVSSVSRTGNGIRTYNRNTGQTTDYSRNGWGNGTGPGIPGNPGGPVWGGGQTSTPPAWAQGTFYSTNGTNISLTINNNGQVTVVNGGQSYYGTFYRNNLTVNGDVSNISRIGNGVRTYNRNTGQTTDYSRNGSGNPGNPGGPVWGGNTSVPPSWAQGMFYSVNNGTISLTINNNGQVTVVNGGQTYYGTYYNGSITVNGDTSTVSQTRNGIRTYNQSQGVTTDYRRSSR